MLNTYVTVDASRHLGRVNTEPMRWRRPLTSRATCTDPLAAGTWLDRLGGTGAYPLQVGCSFLFQQTGTNFIGIGTQRPPRPHSRWAAQSRADTWYDISPAEVPVLSIGSAVNSTDGNLFVGVGAGNNPNIPGGNDTFVGYQAGFTATGSLNTYIGYQSGYGNTPSVPNTGCCNVFTGFSTGVFNTSGGGNTFQGYYSGWQNQDGSGNTYTGYQTGVVNVSGSNNSFFGDRAGNHTTSSPSNGLSGNNNSFFGAFAGFDNTTGYDNVYIGDHAGASNATGNSNVYIANQSPSSSESNTIRIGNWLKNTYAQQSQVFVEPILANTTSNGANVFITAAGQLVMMMSSRRYKDHIADMGDSSSKLFQLRPVTFFYKPQYDDGSHLLQYGLIAEEVAKVYPEMVMYGKDGQPLTVKYQLLAPMLLSELQKQHKVVTAQQDELASLREQATTQRQQVVAQQQEIDTLKSQLQLQNAAFQERLSRLESLVTTQVQTAAVDKAAQPTTAANGNLQ